MKAKTKRLIPVIALLALACGRGQSLVAVPFQILINHLGCDTQGSKRLVVQSAEEIALALAAGAP